MVRGLLLCGLSNEFVAGWPFLWSWGWRGRSDILLPALHGDGTSSLGLLHRKGTEGVRSVKSRSEDAQNVPGQGNESPSESAQRPAFILGIVPPHCSSLSVTLSPSATCAALRQPRQIWLRRAPGCWASKVPHSRSGLWSPHDLLSPSWLPIRHRGFCKNEELRHTEVKYMVRGSQLGRVWGEIQIQVWLQRLYSRTWQDPFTLFSRALTSVYPLNKTKKSLMCVFPLSYISGALTEMAQAPDI